jgi:hypothetical protein
VKVEVLILLKHALLGSALGWRSIDLVEAIYPSSISAMSRVRGGGVLILLVIYLLGFCDTY